MRCPLLRQIPSLYIFFHEENIPVNLGKGIMRFTFFTLILNTAISTHAAVTEKLPNGFEIPQCTAGSQRFYSPNPERPLWIGCRDGKGLFNGLLYQLSYQGELLRVASVKDSSRHGKEIRFGAAGHLEERSYEAGHLQGESNIFKSDQILQRLLPKTMTSKDWLPLMNARSPSLLAGWLKGQPESKIDFEKGRMTRIRFETKDYQFKISPDGRMMAVNHPEMKGLFFIDPGAFWNLGADDLKKAIQTGFGSCKKYSGPIGRFGRHYDHLLFVKETNEKKHVANLAEIRERFMKFCVPDDLREHLGVLECPPQLPGMVASAKCLLPISDQFRIPYHPKFFKYEFGMKLDPETFVNSLDPVSLTLFLTDPKQESMSKFIPPKTLVVLKKKGNRVIYRIFKDRPSSAKPLPADLEDRRWWEWNTLPGFE